MQAKHINAFANCAKEFAKLSYARRLQVGCVIVKDDAIISIGYNGTPAGWDNNCEYEELKDTHDVVYENGIVGSGYDTVLKTKPEVIHAEMNAIGKLAKADISAKGATAFITHAPCVECAKLLYIAGIKDVFYIENYRDLNGVNFLEDCNVKVTKIDEKQKD